MGKFSHYDDTGKSVMVDVGGKGVTRRTARAAGFVRMSEAMIETIENNLLQKGSFFEVARIAGIMAAKKTADLVPMCHPLQITCADVSLSLDRERGGVAIESEVRLDGKTGVEMEALTAVSVAALTVYDMCKAVDKKMVIEGVTLLEKRGGKSDISLQG